tara:strand:- start:16 stop:561 length:546 start_codon:yes stop_codon:yes gene_type:complete
MAPPIRKRITKSISDSRNVREINKIKAQFPKQTKGLDNQGVREVAKKLGVTRQTAIGKDLLLGIKGKGKKTPQYKSLIPSNAEALKNRRNKDEFDKQVKKTLNNKTVEERNKTSDKIQKLAEKNKKPNIVKKVLKSVAKKIIPGGAVAGALTPKKMGDATLKGNEKPFVPKKKMGGVTKKK